MMPSKNSLLKFFILMIVGIVFICFLLFVYLVYELPFDKLEKVEEKLVNHSQENTAEYLLEEGAGVLLSDLKTYFLFSNVKDEFNDWLDELVKEEKLEVQQDEATIKKDIYVPALIENTCKERFCYQHRIEFNYIPSIFWKGLIGIEDVRFLDHFGIDFKSILRAIWRDLKEQRMAQGASTLTQQLVKNLFFTSERSISRKIKEIILSVYIEFKFEKDNILEIYFNEAYWGSLQGIQIRGIYAASMFYFNKKLEHLSSYEAAILISLLKGPGFYNPINNLSRLKERTKLVYDRLVQLQLFASDDALFWNDSHWDNWYKQLVFRNKHKPFYPLSIDRREEKYKLMGEYEYYILKNNIKNMLLDIQERYKSSDFAAKIIMGIPTRSNDGEYHFYSKIEKRLLEAITDEKQQVGSILKPIIYPIFSQNNISFDQSVDMSPIEMNLKSGKWSPKEAHEDSELPSSVSVKEALLHSYNRPVIRLAQEVGFPAVEENLKKSIPELQLPLSEFPSQLLGSIELSMKRVYEIYASFLKNECEKILKSGDESNSTLFILSSPDQTTIRNVVDDSLRGLKFFGKTGTTNNGYNNWFVFYDGLFLGVIWVGFEGKKHGQDFRLFGSTTAFKIFQEFFLHRGKRFNELSCDRFKE